MSKASLATRVADVLHKVVVVGLMSFTGFQAYQIGRNVYEFEIDSPHMHSTYFEDVNAKVIEQRENDARVDGADAYRDEDYIKKQLQASQSYPKK